MSWWPVCQFLDTLTDFGLALRGPLWAITRPEPRYPTSATATITVINCVPTAKLSPTPKDTTDQLGRRCSIPSANKSWDTHNTLTTAGEFPTKVTALCGWCPAVDVCPAAQREGKVAKKEGMAPGAMLGIGETGTVVSINAKPAKTKPEKTAPTPVSDESTTTPAQVSDSRGTNPVSGNSRKEVHTMFEPKPWEETNEDGSLNLASYAATGAFGVVELAVDTLHASAARVTSETVLAFSQTLKEIIDAVFERLGNKETASLQAGRHARLRGALRTSLETMPPPFGEDTETWSEWVRLSKKRTLNVARTAIALWETEAAPIQPWLIFASDYAPIDATVES
jgi:putative RecB family exonuclease